MNQKIIDWTKEIRKKHMFKSTVVLDIGSMDVNGTVRDLFEGVDAEKYIGIDFREGKSVDMVMNAHNLLNTFAPESFDTIICMNMLEHDNHPMATLQQINALLKKNGNLLFAMPTINFPIHDHPGDYWRLTEQGVRDIVFKGYQICDMETIYTKTSDDGKPINPIICAYGRKL